MSVPSSRRKVNGMERSWLPSFCWITKCRCGPVEKPVLPDSAMICPAFTCVPGITRTLSSLRWAYSAMVPSSCRMRTALARAPYLTMSEPLPTKSRFTSITRPPRAARMGRAFRHGDVDGVFAVGRIVAEFAEKRLGHLECAATGIEETKRHGRVGVLPGRPHHRGGLEVITIGMFGVHDLQAQCTHLLSRRDREREGGRGIGDDVLDVGQRKVDLHGAVVVVVDVILGLKLAAVVADGDLRSRRHLDVLRLDGTVGIRRDVGVMPETIGVLVFVYRLR